MGKLIQGRWLTDEELVEEEARQYKSANGQFQRATAGYRNWVTKDGLAGISGHGGFKAEAGRYHLFAAINCPWAHRTLIYRKIKKLESVVSLSLVRPLRTDQGWVFDKRTPRFSDALLDLSAMHELYVRANPYYTGRATVPVLWDKQQSTIVSNESSEIIRMFNQAFDEITGDSQNFYPDQHAAEIDALNEFIFKYINNGTYKAGFARTQSAYDEAVVALFGALDDIEGRLNGKAYLLGDAVTEADWRLLPTLARFDVAYYSAFKCNLRRIKDYPNLSAYFHRLYEHPGIAETIDFDIYRIGYHSRSPMRNPHGIVPQGPRDLPSQSEDIDMNLPQRQDQFVQQAGMSGLINRELEYDARYHPNLGGVTKGGLSNHYPMTLLALHGLGASDEDVANFKAHWPRHRALIEDDLGLVDRGHLNSDNWADYLGKAIRIREFRRVFLDALNTAGSPQDFVALALERMKDGLPMGLFHPLIRLSLVLGHGDKGLIADALAYMAIRYADLYEALDTQAWTGSDSSIPSEWIWREASRTRASIVLEKPIGGGSLHICELLVSEPAIQHLAFNGGYTISPDNLTLRIREISALALRLYLFEPALTTLHALTACQALAELSQRRIDKSTLVALWARYWIWITGLYLEKGAPPILPAIDTAYEGQIVAYDWVDLSARASKTSEVHLIKMAYSCKWLYENIAPDNLFKLAVVNMLDEGSAHPRRGKGLILG